MKAAAATPSGPEARRSWIDALIILALLLAWCLFLAGITRGRPFVFYDSYRDVAYAKNILAGRVWADPFVAGQPPWYPPGGPLLMAGVSAACGVEPIDVYAGSPWWLNGWLPVLIYLVVRAAGERVTAVLAVGFVGLGSLWWTTHMLAPMASVQGVVFALLGLLIWQFAGQRWSGALIGGAWLGLTAWVHPLCAGLPLAGIIGATVCEALRARSRTALLRGAACVAVAGAIAAPLALIVFVPHAKNPTPTRYFAAELRDASYALQFHAPATPVLGLLGAGLLLRRPNRLAWLPGYLLAALAGQAAGYAAVLGGWSLPYVLPHQFQWHTQLALGLAAAVACAEMGRLVWRLVPTCVSRRSHSAAGPLESAAPSGRTAALVAGSVAGVVGIAAFAPAVDEWRRAEGFISPVWRPPRATRGLLREIAVLTPAEATVICEPDIGYRLIAARAGRKLVAVPDGHMNPRLDARARLADLTRMLETDSQDEFRALVRRYSRYDGAWLVLHAGSREELNPARRRYAGWSSLKLAWEDAEGAWLLFRVSTPASHAD